MNIKDFSGKVIIFSAPSGAGKTSIVHSLLKRNMNLEFSVSACTRNKRNNEIHGKDYYFISVDDFKKKIIENEFIEWEEVYSNNYYGTMKNEIQRIWNNKNHVLFDVDVEGGINLKTHFKDKALSIFISPPSIEELRQRLFLRDSENENDLKKRINKAKKELEYMNEFDKVIMNDILDDACKEAASLIRNFLNKG
tara:strand:+ start:1479 stop:2063 length:585 start_codon:yes stop_codon:yes gene_type:complete